MAFNLQKSSLHMMANIPTLAVIYQTVQACTKGGREEKLFLEDATFSYGFGPPQKTFRSIDDCRPVSGQIKSNSMGVHR